MKANLKASWKAHLKLVFKANSKAIKSSVVNYYSLAESCCSWQPLATSGDSQMRLVMCDDWNGVAVCVFVFKSIL